MLGLKSVRFYSLKGIGMDKFNKSDLATLPLMILNANHIKMSFKIILDRGSSNSLDLAVAAPQVPQSD